MVRAVKFCNPHWPLVPGSKALDGALQSVKIAGVEVSRYEVHAAALAVEEKLVQPFLGA